MKLFYCINYKYQNSQMKVNFKSMPHSIYRTKTLSQKKQYSQKVLQRNHQLFSLSYKCKKWPQKSENQQSSLKTLQQQYYNRKSREPKEQYMINRLAARLDETKKIKQENNRKKSRQKKSQERCKKCWRKNNTNKDDYNAKNLKVRDIQTSISMQCKFSNTLKCQQLAKQWKNVTNQLCGISFKLSNEDCSAIQIKMNFLRNTIQQTLTNIANFYQKHIDLLTDDIYTLKLKNQNSSSQLLTHHTSTKKLQSHKSLSSGKIDKREIKYLKNKISQYANQVQRLEQKIQSIETKFKFHSEIMKKLSPYIQQYNKQSYL